MDIDIHGDLVGDTTLVAPCVPLQTLAARVLLPGGGAALDDGARVTARTTAVPTSDPGNPREWRSVPIHVQVDLTGYERLEFDWTVDGPASWRCMKRR